VGVELCVGVRLGVNVGVLVRLGVGVNVAVGVGVAVGVVSVTARHAQNSDVSKPGTLAVAVIDCPRATAGDTTTEKVALPLESVATDVSATSVSPSPYPVPSQAVFEKN
jgi:hypothetical protein